MSPPDRAFLRRRNALWRQLRETAPGTGPFDRLLTELSALIHWDRARILAGLGLSEDLPVSDTALPDPQDPQG